MPPKPEVGSEIRSLSVSQLGGRGVHRSRRDEREYQDPGYASGMRQLESYKYEAETKHQRYEEAMSVCVRRE